MEDLRRYRRMALLVVCSLPLFAAIQYAAYWLRFDGELRPDIVRQISMTLPWFLVVKASCFLWGRVFQDWNRFVTFYDLIALAQATVGSSLVLILGAYFFCPDLNIPRSVFLLDCLGTVALFATWRSAGRLRSDFWPHAFHPRSCVHALIVGTNESGEALLRALRRNRKLHYHIVGFIRRPNDSTPARIAGVPVLGDLRELRAIANRHGVTEVLIMADECTGREVRQIVEMGAAVGAQVKVMPSVEQLLQRHLDVKPRTVSIEDLLRRDPVRLDMRGLHQWIDGRVLLVTGAAGSIGSEICRQLLQFDPQRLVLVDRSENGQFFLQRELQSQANHLEVQTHVADVGDRRRMEQLLRYYRPDIVFHAAAYKHVPLMEHDPGEAIKNIVVSTRVMADLAEACDVKSFVMISTDKAVNPTSVMGACKRVAELYVQSKSATARCQFVTVRFGNVLDSAGSVVPIFRDQIARGGPVTVTHPDMKRYFMMIPEASQLVIQAGAMGHGGEIFVLDMGQPVRIVDLAQEMIHLSGLEVGKDIEIEFIGLRPGEKLFEELHNDGEEHLPTMHPKILVANSTSTPHEDVLESIARLTELVDGPPARILTELRRIVPQYRSTTTSTPSFRRAA